MMKLDPAQRLYKEILTCTHCKNLPLGPKPILRFSAQAPILIAGQAPGIKVHNSGIPWNDASGMRLRKWLGVNETEFYDVSQFSIVPMGFCYPGSKGKGGDLPPRPECSKLWLERILEQTKTRKLTILIGQYSQRYYLQDRMKDNLTLTIRDWKHYLPDFFVLPHPSPTNNRWFAKNPWFEKDVIPSLQEKVSKLLKPT